MITTTDRRLLTEAGREYIFNAVLESNKLKEKLTFKEHVKLCNQVKNLQYEEVIQVIFNEGIRAFESKFSKFLKYSLAAIAGMAGGVFGPPLAMFILYLYRKATDTCVRSCFAKLPLSPARKICKLECQLNAAKKMETDLRSNISKCSYSSRPTQCEKKLQKEYIKWAKRVQLLTVRLNRAKMSSEEALRKQRQAELKRRAQELKDSLDLSNQKIMNFILENKTLRKNISFKNHLRLYEVSTYLKEDEDVKPPQIDPKKEKLIRHAMYLGLWVVPIPFFNDLVNYLVKKYSFGCATKCLSQKKLPQTVCYTQCAYLGSKYAVKFLNEQLSKCNKSKEPIKCKKKIYNLLEDWKQREIERKIKFDSALRDAVRKQKG